MSKYNFVLSAGEFRQCLREFFDNQETKERDHFYESTWQPFIEHRAFLASQGFQITGDSEVEKYKIFNEVYQTGYIYATENHITLSLPEYIILREIERSEEELNSVRKFDSITIDSNGASYGCVDGATLAAPSATTISYTSTPSSVLDGIKTEGSPYETCTVGSLISDITTKADLYVNEMPICSTLDTKADKAYVNEKISDEFAKTNAATTKLGDALDALAESLKNYIDPLNIDGGAELATLEKAGFIEFKNNSYIKINDEKKGNNVMMNFDFGPCVNHNIKMSMYGLAVKSPVGEWVSYNKETGEIFTVSDMTFGDGSYFYKIPVAIKDVTEGDLVIHNRAPMYVEHVCADGTLRVIDVLCGEKKNIILSKSPWGFNFVTKIVSLMDMMNTGDSAPSADNPFGGNMFALMMMSGDTKFDPMMFMLMGGGMKDMNPMMMYALMANKK